MARPLKLSFENAIYKRWDLWCLETNTIPKLRKTWEELIKPLSCSPRGAGHYLTAEIEAVDGLPRLFPRYKVSSPVYYKGDLILNNINIQNSNVGVINTGNVESIDVSLTFLKEQGNEEIAELIKILTKEIIKNKDIVENQKMKF